jgi:hypothetical protein
VQVEAGVRGQPVLDRWGLVGGVVVADLVHVQLGRYGFVDRDKEFLELHRPVTGSWSSEITEASAMLNAANRLLTP